MLKWVEIWTNETSGAPHGSVFGSVLFFVYINDIDESVTGIMSEFVDETKIVNTVTSNNQVKAMQKNLDRLSE